MRKTKVYKDTIVDIQVVTHKSADKVEDRMNLVTPELQIVRAGGI